MKGLDKRVKLIRLEGETSEEIAKNYEKVVNDLFQKAEPRYSQSNKKMMIWGPINPVVREIKGDYFIDTDYGFYLNGDEEDSI